MISAIRRLSVFFILCNFFDNFASRCVLLFNVAHQQALNGNLVLDTMNCAYMLHNTVKFENESQPQPADRTDCIGTDANRLKNCNAQHEPNNKV